MPQNPNEIQFDWSDWEDDSGHSPEPRRRNIPRPAHQPPTSAANTNRRTVVVDEIISHRPTPSTLEVNQRAMEILGGMFGASDNRRLPPAPPQGMSMVDHYLQMRQQERQQQQNVVHSETDAPFVRATQTWQSPNDEPRNWDESRFGPGPR